ncbi:MAG TPA: PH domain-containing protein, partial [Myxococcota bacterium]|nr:PH domain-containing protein [Myxococcota bacterium]
TYQFLIGARNCLASVVGILLLPFWVLGLGQWYARESIRRTYCALGERSIDVRQGIFFRSEAHIPLDKVTDLKVYQGPLMRWLGIHGLRIETAGQGTPAQSSEGQLIGVKDALMFRNRVVSQRDLVTEQNTFRSSPALGDAPLLREVRDILLRIEAELRRR